MPMVHTNCHSAQTCYTIQYTFGIFFYCCWPFAHNAILGMQTLIQYCLCTHNLYAPIALK